MCVDAHRSRLPASYRACVCKGLVAFSVASIDPADATGGGTTFASQIRLA